MQLRPQLVATLGPEAAFEVVAALSSIAVASLHGDPSNTLPIPHEVITVARGGSDSLPPFQRLLQLGLVEGEPIRGWRVANNVSLSALLSEFHLEAQVASRALNIWSEENWPQNLPWPPSELDSNSVAYWALTRGLALRLCSSDLDVARHALENCALTKEWVDTVGISTAGAIATTVLSSSVTGLSSEGREELMLLARAPSLLRDPAWPPSETTAAYLGEKFQHFGVMCSEYEMKVEGESLDDAELAGARDALVLSRGVMTAPAELMGRLELDEGIVLLDPYGVTVLRDVDSWFSVGLIGGPKWSLPWTARAWRKWVSPSWVLAIGLRNELLVLNVLTGQVSALFQGALVLRVWTRRLRNKRVLLVALVSGGPGERVSLVVQEFEARAPLLPIGVESLYWDSSEDVNSVNLEIQGAIVSVGSVRAPLARSARALKRSDMSFDLGLGGVREARKAVSGAITDTFRTLRMDFHGLSFIRDEGGRPLKIAWVDSWGLLLPEPREQEHLVTDVAAELKFRLWRSVSEGKTPEKLLWLACARNSERAVRIVLDNFESSTGWRSVIGQTPLHAVARTGAMEAGRALLNALGPEATRSLDVPDEYGWTPMHMACRHGQPRVARWLVRDLSTRHGDTRNSFGSTPLAWAAYRGQLELCKLLIVQGKSQSIEKYQKIGWRPLAEAIWGGHSAVVKFLVERGHANILSVTRGGLSALEFAVIYGRPQEIIDYLRPSFPNADETIDSLKPVYAAVHGQPATLATCIDEGTDPNMRLPDKSTLLMWATLPFYDDCFKILLKAGADITAVDGLGRNVLHWAAASDAIHRNSLTEELDIDGQDDDGNTALALAVKLSRPYSVVELMKRGANPNIPDNKGVSPIDWCVKGSWIHSLLTEKWSVDPPLPKLFRAVQDVSIEGAIPIREGDFLTVHGPGPDEGWYEGENTSGVKGLFSSSFLFPL